jgi:hypothetical protein
MTTIQNLGDIENTNDTRFENQNNSHQISKMHTCSNISLKNPDNQQKKPSDVFFSIEQY